jgi:ABC-type multidrug transport system fused ATPase/permease subunit
VFSYVHDQKCIFAIGVILTLLIGGIYPIFSIFLSDIINALFDLSTKAHHDYGRQQSDLAALVFLILAVGGFLVTFARDIVAYTVGNEITNNIRREAYNKILKMPV